MMKLRSKEQGLWKVSGQFVYKQLRYLLRFSCSGLLCPSILFRAVALPLPAGLLKRGPSFQNQKLHR
jgi:hypothetical protein